MNCPNCGSQNSDSSKFCIHCGHALPVRADTEHTAQESGTISEAERVSAPSEVVADRAGQTEDEVPAVSVSAAEAEVCESSAERKQIKPVSVGGAARADRRARRACDTCERRALHRCRCI